MFGHARILRQVASRIGGSGRKAILLLTSDINANVGAGVTAFLYTSSHSGNEIQIPLPFDCTVRNLQAVVVAGPGAGQTFAYTVRKNAVDTGITATISGTATTATDLINEVIYAQADTIGVKLVTSAAAVTTYHQVTIELEALP